MASNTPIGPQRQRTFGGCISWRFVGRPVFAWPMVFQISVTASGQERK